MSVPRPDLRYLGAAQAFAVGLKANHCPCQWPHTVTETATLAFQAMAEDDPGPTHIPSCPWIDPDYDDGGF